MRRPVSWDVVTEARAMGTLERRSRTSAYSRLSARQGRRNPLHLRSH